MSPRPRRLLALCLMACLVCWWSLGQRVAIGTEAAFCRDTLIADLPDPRCLVIRHIYKTIDRTVDRYGYDYEALLPQLTQMRARPLTDEHLEFVRECLGGLPKPG